MRRSCALALVTAVFVNSCLGAMRSAIAADALPGLIPSPAEGADGQRWQMLTAMPRGNINAVAWSPKGGLIAYAESGNVRICRDDSLELQHVLLGHNGSVDAIRFSPDGSKIATAGSDSTVRIWSTDGFPGPVLRGHAAAVRSIAWSPDSRQIVSGSLDGTVRFWNASGEPGLVIEGHAAPVNCVAWSPDGTSIVAGDDNRLCRVWDLEGQPKAEFAGHRGPVATLDWSPDGSMIASGSLEYLPSTGDERSESWVRVWKPDGTEVRVLGPHTDLLLVVVWSPDGSRIVSAGWDGDIKLWDPNTDEQAGTVGNVFHTFSIAWSPNGRRMIAGSRHMDANFPGGVSLFDLADGGSRQIPVKSNGFTAVAVNRDGTQLAAGDSQSNVRTWLIDGVPQFSGRTASEEPRPIWTIDWSPTEDRFVAAGERFGYSFFEPATGKTETRSQGSRVYGLDWGANGLIAAALINRSVQIFDPAEEDSRTLSAHLHSTTDVAWNSEGTLLASCGFDSAVNIWNAEGTQQVSLPDYSAPTRSVCWSPDGTKLASGREDKTIKLWDADGTPGPVLTGHGGYVQSVSWSPDGAHIASGSWDGTVRIWTADGEPERVYKGHQGSVYSVCWTPDSQSIVSASLDGTLHVWNASTGDLQWMSLVSDTGETVTLGPGGELLNGDQSVIERECLYAVEAPDGRLTLYSPAEFQERAGAGQ